MRSFEFADKERKCTFNEVSSEFAKKERQYTAQGNIAQFLYVFADWGDHAQQWKHFAVKFIRS